MTHRLSKIQDVILGRNSNQRVKTVANRFLKKVFANDWQLLSGCYESTGVCERILAEEYASQRWEKLCWTRTHLLGKSGKTWCHRSCDWEGGESYPLNLRHIWSHRKKLCCWLSLVLSFKLKRNNRIYRPTGKVQPRAKAGPSIGVLLGVSSLSIQFKITFVLYNIIMFLL